MRTSPRTATTSCCRTEEAPSSTTTRATTGRPSTRPPPCPRRKSALTPVPVRIPEFIASSHERTLLKCFQKPFLEWNMRLSWHALGVSSCFFYDPYAARIVLTTYQTPTVSPRKICTDTRASKNSRFIFVELAKGTGSQVEVNTKNKAWATKLFGVSEAVGSFQRLCNRGIGDHNLSVLGCLLSWGTLR